MKRVILTLIICCLACCALSGQDRKITGRVISEDIKITPGGTICNMDKNCLGCTDKDGRFELTIPAETSQLKFYYLGMEITVVSFSADCNHLEVTMMGYAIYDFITLKRENRLRKKRYNKLPAIHKEAYDKGIFVNKKPCCRIEFIPH